MPATDTPGSTHTSQTKSTSSHGHVDSPTTNVNPSPRKSSGQHNTLSIRSCVTCRKRKVRCDKVHPSCGNCTKAHIECIFPGPGRAPRKSRKPPDTELLARLRRLEGVVQSLGAQVDDEGTVTQNGVVQSPRAMATIADQLHRSDSGRNSPGSDASGEAGYVHRGSMDKQVGRLVINEGRSRYVSNAFWASMGDEVCFLGDCVGQMLTESRSRKCVTYWIIRPKKTMMSWTHRISRIMAWHRIIIRGLSSAIRLIW